MSICVIPARGGSKRVPRKNIRLFHGRPMIAWSITAAKKAGCFDRVVVSTDDDEIAAVAEAEGAEVPFKRPVTLADDFTDTATVIAHASRALGLDEDVPVCCLYATAPLVRPDDIVAGHEMVQKAKADYVLSVCRFPYPIQRALFRDKAGHVAMINPENISARSQDLDEAWHDAGQFYWAKSTTWMSGKAILTSSAIGLELPAFRVQDIDTEEDWERAEALFSLSHSEGFGQ